MDVAAKPSGKTPPAPHLPPMHRTLVNDGFRFALPILRGLSRGSLSRPGALLRMCKARIPPWTAPAATLEPRLRPPARHRLAVGRCAGRSGMARGDGRASAGARSEEHTSELQSLMRTSYAVFCWKKKNQQTKTT